MSAHVRLVRRADLHSTEVDGEIMVFDPGTGEVLHLDAVASVLWEVLAEPTLLADLWPAVAAAFGIPEADARRDAEPFLDELTRRQLLAAC